MHLLFMRKNKTIRSILKEDKVLSLLERNLQTYCAIQNIPIDNVLAPPKTMKSLVNEILDRVGLAEYRAAKMDLTQFLTLLDAFHQQHIHFC
jgi:18S rRNA (adenine1779-N6/adenine1780-N6)-dimethyltransferase